MAIIAKLIVERTEKPIRNKHFFGEVKKSQKSEETSEFEKMNDVTLPKFDKVQIVFNEGSYSYKVTIDKHLFEYNDACNSFECVFSNTDGNVFELNIFNDEITLKKYYSRSEYDEDDCLLVIEDAVVHYLYGDDVKEC